jgi:hypothetical protein
MTLVVLLVLGEILLLLLAHQVDWRRALVGASLAWSIVLLALSEMLSAVGAFARIPLFAAWAVAAAALALPVWRARANIRKLADQASLRHWSLDTFVFCVCCTLGVTLIIALIAPPNTADSMTYHMGRVAEWIDHRSLDHFATHVERQITLSPFAEIVIANLQALSGGDRFANLVQWFAFGLSAAGVSLLLQEVGGDQRAQRLAAVVVLTTPMAILQATSTQNDLVASFFVVVAALACVSLRPDFRSGIVLGLAAGLAMLTKGTAPVFVAPFAIWAFARLVRAHRPRRAVAVLGLSGVVALGINTPHWLRNQRVYSNFLGTQWLTKTVGNEVVGLAATYSNLVRNAASHLGVPTASARAFVTAAVSFLHRIVGLDPNDPRTTAFGEFTTGYFTMHEDKAANTIQLMLFTAAMFVLVFRKAWLRSRISLFSFGGFVLFGMTFKWQPWGNRLHTPFFILAAVTIGAELVVVLKRHDRWVMLALLLAATPWLLANSTRSLVPSSLLPAKLQGTSIWARPRIEQYFANRPEDYRSFTALNEQIRSSGCVNLGVLGDEDSWTYVLHLVFEGRASEATIRPALVRNPTAMLIRPGPEPCALVSLAFGRIPGLENTSLERFHLTERSGPFALYLPLASPPLPSSDSR